MTKCRLQIIYLSLLVAIPLSSLADIHKPDMAVTKKGMIVTCQPLAAQAGIEILRKGGNAADAFITTTLAEYVTAFGYTSLSGPIYLLYYDAKTKKISYLNAGLNKVRDPEGQWDPKKPSPGTSYVIGGAGLALESLHQKFGSGEFKFSQLTAPASSLARTGFPLDASFAGSIRARAPLFAQSKEWNAIYQKNGKPLSRGETLVQTQLADTLDNYGKEGANYLFKGRFAQSLVSAIHKNGGKLTLQDLKSYQINWADPIQAQYRGFTVVTGSYRSFGGLQLLLGLKTIENYSDFGSKPRFFEDRDTFEKVLRSYLFSLRHLILDEARFKNFESKYSSNAAMEGLLKGSAPAELWSQVINPKIPTPFNSQTGAHSCNTLVIDRSGNIVTGLHTINALPWGDGLVVNGVSMNSAYGVAMDSPPGERALDSTIPVLILKDNKPWAAAGFFAGGLQPAAFQVLLNLMDYGMAPNDAIYAPRFGEVNDYQSLAMNLDPRFPTDWVNYFSKNGVRFKQPTPASAYIDTGDAMVIRIDPEAGMRSGSPTEKLPQPVALGE